MAAEQFERMMRDLVAGAGSDTTHIKKAIKAAAQAGKGKV